MCYFVIMVPKNEKEKTLTLSYCVHPTPPSHSRQRGKKYSFLTHASILFLSRVHPDISIPSL